MFTVSARKPAKERRQLQFRRLRQISLPVLKQEITSWTGDYNHDTPASDMATAYNSGLLEIIDHLAPLCTKTVTLHPHAPWYTDELRDEKRRRRSAEHLWLSSRLEVHRQKIPDAACRIQPNVDRHEIIIRTILARSPTVDVTQNSCLTSQST